jgi:hypothetical protein
MCPWHLIGREAHNHKEGKVLKEVENMVDTKSLRLDSPKIDGTQAQTHAYMCVLLCFHLFKTACCIILSSPIHWKCFVH